MSLNIGEVLSTGVEKLTTTAGIQLGIAYVVLQLITAVGTNSAVATVDTGAGPTPVAGGMGTSALALPIGIAGGAALFTLGLILNVALTIVAFRTWHTTHTNSRVSPAASPTTCCCPACSSSSPASSKPSRSCSASSR
jgi:hypothetical protein